MPNFPAKNEQVLNRQLKTQELCLCLSITGNATPASVVLSADEPALLRLKSQGVDQITSALSSGEASPSFVSQVDANGLFSAMIVVGEQVSKVLSAQLIKRSVHGADSAKIANVTGISAFGDKIVLDCDSTVDLSAANLDACLMVKYQTHQ